MPGPLTREPFSEQSDSFFYEELYHDLKTPMSILFANIQLLERMSALPSQAVRYLQEAKKNCFRMAKLVWDANDRAKINKGMLLPHFVNGDIVSLVRGLCDDARVLTDPKGIQICFKSLVAAKLMAVDRQIMERILLNLLSNAKYYSYENSNIDVTLWENADNMFISVRDFGPGVSADMANRIFLRNASDAVDGTHSGLGLYIARELAALMGGEVFKTDTSPGVEIVLRLPVFLTDEAANDIPIDDFFYDNMVQMELSC